MGNDPFWVGNDPFSVGNNQFSVGNNPFSVGSNPYSGGSNPFSITDVYVPGGRLLKCWLVWSTVQPISREVLNKQNVFKLVHYACKITQKVIFRKKDTFYKMLFKCMYIFYNMHTI